MTCMRLLMNHQRAIDESPADENRVGFPLRRLSALSAGTEAKNGEGEQHAAHEQA